MQRSVIHFEESLPHKLYYLKNLTFYNWFRCESNDTNNYYLYPHDTKNAAVNFTGRINAALLSYNKKHQTQYSARSITTSSGEFYTLLTYQVLITVFKAQSYNLEKKTKSYFYDKTTQQISWFEVTNTSIVTAKEITKNKRKNNLSDSSSTKRFKSLIDIGLYKKESLSKSEKEEACATLLKLSQ